MKKEINFVMVLSLIVSIAFFIILSSKVFNLDKAYEVTKKCKRFQNVSSEKIKKDLSSIQIYDTEKENADMKESGLCNAAKEFADVTTNLVKSRDYKKIYLEGNNNMKAIGTEDEFSDYMKIINDTYGELNEIEFQSYSLSQDNSEVKINYTPYSNKISKKIFLTLWVKKENEQLYLSGIKFTENSW